MKCIIIEDQPPAQRILKKYIEEMGSLQLTGTFVDPIEAMVFLKSETVDLVFLDIHLSKMSGIDLLKIMPQMPPVILTTAFPDYALESYELDVLDYLLKPFSFQRFVKAVSKVSPHIPINKNPIGTSPSHFIKSGYDYIRISFEDIIYIKSDADYSEIFLSNKKHLSSEPLKNWLDILDGRWFVRVHKSYIVNTTKIIKVTGNQLYMVNKESVPIGRAYKDDFFNRI